MPVPSKDRYLEETIVHSPSRSCSDGPARRHCRTSPPSALPDAVPVPYALAHPGLDIPLLNQSAGVLLYTYEVPGPRSALTVAVVR